MLRAFPRKARKLAPGAFAKMNGGRKPVSYGSCEEALEALAKTEFDAAVELVKLCDDFKTSRGL